MIILTGIKGAQIVDKLCFLVFCEVVPVGISIWCGGLSKEDMPFPMCHHPVHWGPDQIKR